MLTGQQSYERELARIPTFIDGTARPSWNELNPLAQQLWIDNPHDRAVICCLRVDVKS